MTANGLLSQYFLLRPILKRFIIEKDRELESKESLLLIEIISIPFVILMFSIAILRG